MNAVMKKSKIGHRPSETMTCFICKQLGPGTAKEKLLMGSASMIEWAAAPPDQLVDVQHREAKRRTVKGDIRGVCKQTYHKRCL